MRIRHFCIFLLIFLILFQSTITTLAKSDYMPMTCEEKLKNLEPLNPKTMYDYELIGGRDPSEFKETVSPISLIQKSGINIPFITVYKDFNWKRPAYVPTWHSSSWRWSYVPTNMAYQQHIVFDYEMGASWWLDLSSDLALPNGTELPSPINESAFTIKYPYVVRLIVFNFNIKSIKYYKNQIIVSGEPQRKGLTMVDFDTKNLTRTKKLLQLATPDGYERDYLILYLQ